MFVHCEQGEAIQSVETVREASGVLHVIANGVKQSSEVTGYFFSTETAPFASGIFPKRGKEKEDAF